MLTVSVIALPYEFAKAGGSRNCMAKTATELLSESCCGAVAATTELTEQVYDELRQIADRHLRGERADHSLQPTALVHEAFLRLIDQRSVEWQNSAHFRGIASQVMRRVLVDHARSKASQKRGRGFVKIAMEATPLVNRDSPLDVAALNDLLSELGRLNERHAAVVEQRVFGGMTIEETAAALQISPATVKNDWRAAKAWLCHQLDLQNARE